MILFFILFFIIIGSFAAYITWRMLIRANLSRMSRVAIAMGIVAIVFLVPLNILLRRSGIENKLIDTAAWTGYLGLGYLSFVFTFLVIRDLPWAAVALYKKIGRFFFGRQKVGRSNDSPENPLRRAFLINGMNHAILGGSVLFSAYGFYEAQRVPRVRKVEIRIGALPGDLEGFRIAQITDIHVSPTIGRPFVEGVVKTVNNLKADIMSVTPRSMELEEIFMQLVEDAD